VGALVGTLVFAPGNGHWWLLLTALFVSVLGAGTVFVQNALRLPPPGGFFIVMVTGGATMLARAGIDPLQAAFWPLTAIATGLVLGMLPALLDPHGPERATVAFFEVSGTTNNSLQLACAIRVANVNLAVANRLFELSEFFNFFYAAN